MGRLLDEVIEKYRGANRVEAVDLEVTHRCPCRCEHCYLDHAPTDELNLDEIASLFSQLREDGVLELGITGGDPFVRHDIFEILSLARKDRFFVTILTSGVLIGPDDVKRLEDLHVRRVEMSLLGATAKTHDAIMKYTGAFDRIIRSAEMLIEAKIQVTLKTTVLRQNYRELDTMARLAGKLRAGFAANYLIAPQIDGNTAPQRCMLDDSQLAEIDRTYLDGPLTYHDSNSAGAVLTCQAGKTVAAIDPSGNVFPCVLFRANLGNIRDRTLREIWIDDPDSFLTELRILEDEDVEACYLCKYRKDCRRCPGIAYLETGRLGLPSITACRLAASFEAPKRFG